MNYELVQFYQEYESIIGFARAKSVRKNNFYNINVYYVCGKLHLEVIDYNGSADYKDALICDEEEANKVMSLIRDEFIVNHAGRIKYSAFKPLSEQDRYNISTAMQAYKLNTSPIGITGEKLDEMIIHYFENDNFGLNLYLNNGIDKESLEVQDKLMGRTKKLSK